MKITPIAEEQVARRSAATGCLHGSCRCLGVAHHYDCRCRLGPLESLGHVSLLVISLLVALLLAALLSPAVMLLRKKGVRAGGAAAIAEIGMILVLAGIISLTGQQILRGFVSMADNAMQGYQRLIGWLKNLGYEFGATS